MRTRIAAAVAATLALDGIASAEPAPEMHRDVPPTDLVESVTCAPAAGFDVVGLVLATDGSLFRFAPDDRWRSCSQSGETRYSRSIGKRYAGAVYIRTISAKQTAELFALARQLPGTVRAPDAPCPPGSTPTEVSLVSERTPASATFTVIGRYECVPPQDTELLRRFFGLSAQLFSGAAALAVPER
jgi:hypothetical protein